MTTAQFVEKLATKRRRFRFLRDHYRKRCYYCGARTTIPHPGEPKRLTERTMDHVVPLSKGGKDNLGNVVLSCLRCNREKGDRDVMEFIDERVRGSRVG